MTVQPGERLSFSSVYDNQAADVHPPLYYWLFHIVSSLTPGLFSKWTGLALGLLLYLGTLLLLYALLRELFTGRIPALAGVAMYGLSLIGLSTMLMIRMYVLLTLLTVMLAWCVARLMREQKPGLYILTSLAIFAGVMTQYYFVFYAFFLCTGFILYSLRKRDLRGALLFAVSALAGIGLLPACFPPCLGHLFADKLVSGGNALENLGNPSQYLDRLLYYCYAVVHGMIAAILIALAVTVSLLLQSRQASGHAVWERFPRRALLVIVPAFAALVLIAVISPVQAVRYVYSLCPIFTVAVSTLIAWLEASTRDRPASRLSGVLLLGGVLPVCLLLACLMEPSYQFPDHADYNARLAHYSGSPCVYLTDNYVAPPTQDLIQLLTFDEVFITSSPDSDALGGYLDRFGGRDCVVYIDVDEFWSSGFDPEVMLPKMLSHGYRAYSSLYSYGLSQCYLFTGAGE